MSIDPAGGLIVVFFYRAPRFFVLMTMQHSDRKNKTQATLTAILIQVSLDFGRLRLDVRKNGKKSPIVINEKKRAGFWVWHGAYNNP